MEFSFRPEHFQRLDDDQDESFYTMPRKVVHIDDTAIGTIKEFFREILPANAVVLDLLSSWRSHWPNDLPKQRLVGLGLNAEEMADNPDLDAYVVHNVNIDPQLPFETGTFDAVIITVSIQYLTQPIAVFQEVHRILRPGGMFIVIFSNRMFPTKAVAIWRMLDDDQHLKLVYAYFQTAGGFVDITAHNRTPFSPTYTDPVYVVMARTPAAPQTAS
jgi:SAM-dependent methyltransferase